VAGDIPVGGSQAGCGGVLLEEKFAAGSLHMLRQAVAAHAAAAGMSEAPVIDVTLAVNELAANAVRHGAGRLRMWCRDGALCCQVEDAGRGPRGRAGTGPDAAAGWPYEQGHGLWLAWLVADELIVTSGPGGTYATVTFALG
jgi:anti-sigma regulatory factor (Ser/Thr protein kinase)